MSNVEIFALIVLPAVVAAAGFAAAVFYDQLLTNHSVHDGASFKTDAHSELGTAFAKFERFFLNSSRRYSPIQLRIIHTPLGTSPD